LDFNLIKNIEELTISIVLAATGLYASGTMAFVRRKSEEMAKNSQIVTRKEVVLLILFQILTVEETLID
jgi:hypothetical protein